jgi:hypothetical protein
MLHSKRKNTLNGRKRSNIRRHGQRQKRFLIGGLKNKESYAEVPPSSQELSDVSEISEVKLVKELIDEHLNDHNYYEALILNVSSARGIIENDMDRANGYNKYLYDKKNANIEIMNYILKAQVKP